MFDLRSNSDRVLSENIETTLRLQSFRLTFTAFQWFYHTFTVKITGSHSACYVSVFVCMCALNAYESLLYQL